VANHNTTLLSTTARARGHTRHLTREYRRRHSRARAGIDGSPSRLLPPARRVSR
jgi:hypothetical protein